ncbi:MAG: hypothetical protein KGI60_03095 [Patescibacteria group bacterium]|nr:hypothetical protein [Patescibacteria group bacterium]
MEKNKGHIRLAILVVWSVYVLFVIRFQGAIPAKYFILGFVCAVILTCLFAMEEYTDDPGDGNSDSGGGGGDDPPPDEPPPDLPPDPERTKEIEDLIRRNRPRRSPKPTLR